jgi:hypothetical protein
MRESFLNACEHVGGPEEVREKSPPVRQFDFAKTLYPQLPNEDANDNLVLAVDDAEEKQEENVMVSFNWHLLGKLTNK